jgi:ribonucleoside-diphosphate reductase alpha chain
VFRNSRVTLLAPTGTIGFFLDCSTFGIEPNLALVKYKLLADCGSLKLVNQTVPLALRWLVYTDEITEIIAYIDEHDSIKGCPLLKPEHLPVFDCSFAPANGTGSIHHSGQIGMMAAAQPFLSGAISKTVNMPTEATIEEIEEAYKLAWRSGLKSVTIFWDGLNGSQPMTTKKSGSEIIDMSMKIELDQGLQDAVLALVLEQDFPPRREKMPDRRRSECHKFRIAGHKGYLHAGFYPDGRLGEIFVTVDAEGSLIAGLMNTIAATVSMGLQYGVPLEAFVHKFAFTKFEPLGPTGDLHVPIAQSLVDYLFRKLEACYHGGRMPAAHQELDDRIVVRVMAVLGADQPTTKLRPDNRACDRCGNLAGRRGTCYSCGTCGETSGCG